MWTTEPRWDYLLHYFVLQLPLVVLALCAAATVLAAAAWWRRREHVTLHQRSATLVLMAAVLAPPAYAIVVRAVLYDGLRHFLFLVPVLIVVASLGAVALPRAFPAKARPLALATRTSTSCRR